MLKKSSNYSVVFSSAIFLFFSYSYFRDWYILCNSIDKLIVWIHEIGHIIFSIFWNTFLTFAWWTITQIVVPIIMMFQFIKKDDYFAASFMIFILWLSFRWVSHYVASTLSEDPVILFSIVKPTWPIIPDWEYMLWELWLYSHIDSIALFFKTLSIICLLISFFCWLLLIYNKFREDYIFKSKKRFLRDFED